MKLHFKGDVDEILDLLGVVDDDQEFGNPEGFFIPWDDLAEVDSAYNVAADGKQTRIGPVQRFAMMRKFAQSGGRLRDWRRLTDDEILASIHKTAQVKKLEYAPSAIGDGQLLKTFLDFISEHWDDILKILLAMLGL